MSWNVNNTGTKEEVVAALDEALANQQGMPPVVGAYLKAAVAAIELKPGYLVRVESTGHRPMSGAGSTEVCKVELVKSGPWNLK
jgi:hypothetical protein